MKKVYKKVRQQVDEINIVRINIIDQKAWKDLKPPCFLFRIIFI
ncbi:hypothetical protein [Thomasclavelia cocleata]|nr:hypothetical protein [Thomasclavelia cocleata]